MENNSNSSWSFLKDDVMKGLAIALVIIFLFSSGNILGSLMNVKTETADVDATTTTAPTTTAPTTAPTTTAPTAAPSGDDTTTTAAPSGDTTTTAAPSNGAPQTKAEIIAYFNESANKVKTDATKVVRNYEDLRHNEEKLVVPSALQSIGSNLISTFLKKNETPVEYASNADIIASYPAAGETWSSKLTEADVAEATCTDNGSEYEIMIKLNTTTDPAAGTGAAAAFSTIKTEDVMDAAGFVVQSFSAEYYDCVIKCKIDKATGHTTWSNYTLPILLRVEAKVMVTLNAEVGMTFEHDYTITY
ncbi:MAG: hypothetical protein IJW86_02635 [Clostridia bacterium]|nr:hypothetical protein [Clostridia bacterium]